MGSFGAWGETKLKRVGRLDVYGGSALYLACVLLFTIPAWLLTKVPTIGRILEVVASSLLLSTRSLFSEVEEVFTELKRGRIELARKKLSYLVTRETQNMEEEAISSACIETLSENFVDAIVSPILYLAAGGLPLLVIYKVTSTFDSMFGYREGYLERFGKVPAKMDDIMNFIPARISPFLIFISSWIMGYPSWSLLEKLRKDSGKTESPNSWIPESTCAHAIGIEIGGRATYFGKELEKPYMGSPRAPNTPSKVMEAIILLSTSTFILFCLLSFLYLL